MRVAAMLAAMLVTGCGPKQSGAAPPTDMPLRTWQFYAAHPEEIEPMQKVCRAWAGSAAPAGSEPAVIAANCRAAAFAKSQRQIGN
jgi:hypothetical protein